MPRRSRRLGAFALVLGLAVMAQPALLTLEASDAVAVDTKKKPAAAPAEKVTSRPDAVSARVTAKAQGAQVEIESARTEFSTTWANPDGTLTTDTYTGAIRYLENGVWRDVDLNLAAAPDGTVRVRKHARGLKLSGKTTAATETMVSVTEKPGQEVALGWSKKLPAPVIEGTKATFPEIEPGVDMVIDSRRSGFEQTFVLKTRPTAPMSWQVPLRTKGLTARAEKDGSVSFVDAKDKVISSMPPAVAWDAAINPNTGDHASVSPVQMTVTQKNKNRAILTITPDPVWLLDESRALPIEVDPAYSSTLLRPSYDAFVQEGVTSDQSTSTELKLGNNGSGQRARSFLRFPGSVEGYDVVNATLSLYATHSWSCSTRSWEVWNTDTASTTTRWTAQPSWGSVQKTSNVTKGYSSSCADGWVNLDITDWVGEYWTRNSSSRSMGLRATDETDPYGWKKFASSEASNGPKLSVTFNGAPGQAAAPSLSPVNPWAPPGGTSSLYTWDSTPAFTALAGDLDSDSVKLRFEVHPTTTAATATATCDTAYVAPGAAASCSPSVALADNTTYHVRAKAYDGRVWAAAWSPWQHFTTAFGTPVSAGISCPAPHTNGSWLDTAPAANVQCTITATGSGGSSPGYIRYWLDGAPEVRKAIVRPTSGNPTTFPVTFPKAEGGHTLYAQTVSPAWVGPALTEYQFGYGTAGLVTPNNDPTVAAGRVAVEVQAPPRITSAAPNVALKWRVAGETDPNAGWQTAAPAHAALSVKSDPPTDLVKVTGWWDTAASLATLGISDRVPTRLEMQVCLTYTGLTGTKCTGNGDDRVGRVQHVPHAFGNGFPTTEAGPGQVALWTGEFQTSATDVQVPGYTGSLAISRSHSTYADDLTPEQRIFGPGWVPNFDGPQSGIAGWRVLDTTRQDGTIALISPEGTALIYAAPGGVRRTGAALIGGTYTAVDEDSELSGTKLTVNGAGTGTTITFTEDSGTKTVFRAAAPPTDSANATFLPQAVIEPGAHGTTSYSRDGAGRINRIIAPVPPGVTCEPDPANPDAALLIAGCRSLRLVYGAANGGGDALGQVKSIWMDIHQADEAGTGGAPAAIEVLRYTYDGDKRLIKVRDLRSNLAIEYTYTGEAAKPRLKTVTPGGLTPFELHYTTWDNRPVLEKVTRERPSNSSPSGIATLASVRYGIDRSAAGLPDLSGTTVQALWGQNKAPAYAAAVFGPGHPAPASIGTADWSHAQLYYTDDLGYTVNTAAYGAGDWQIGVTDYTPQGNVRRVLDPAATAEIRRLAQLTPPVSVNADLYATITSYNPDIKNANGDVLTEAGTLVTKTEGPVRWALTNSGAWEQLRPVTTITYEHDEPTVTPPARDGDLVAMPYRLPITTTVKAVPLSGGDGDILNVTRNDYDAIGGVSGWHLGVPTKVTTLMGGDASNPRPDITRVTVFDAEGRIVETRQPQAAANDAGTMVTTYYTAGADGGADCGNKPAWAGLACQIAPGDGASSVLPTQRITGYSTLLAPTRVEETRAGTTRTTTTRYTDDGKVTKVSTTVAGLSSSEPVPGTLIGYDAVTGLPTKLTQLDSNGNTTATEQVTGYDAWGRTTSYSPSGGSGATATSYDAAGRVSTVENPKGATTWFYDGATNPDGKDALGNIERRGLPTKMSVSNPGGAAVEFTGAYDSSGALVEQSLPGGITQHLKYDIVGNLEEFTYTGTVTTTTGSDPHAAWLTWHARHDALGRVRQDWTPAGAGFTNLPTGKGIAYDRQYHYNRAGRLETVQDRTAGGTGTLIDLATPDSLKPACQTRRYEFDPRGTRTSLTTWAANEQGGCSTAGSGTPTTWSYNSADQLLGVDAGVNGTGTYDYDRLGRTINIPAADAPNGVTAGSITVGYYDTDAVRTLMQGDTTTTYSLDAAGRRKDATTTVPGGTPTVLERHYADSSDNPAWIKETDGQGSTVTRYVGSLGTAVAEITDSSTVTLSLPNPHGDIVTEVEIPGGPATGISGWADYDEYGNPSGSKDSAGPGYGWLGANERATDDTGLILMGARLYNPASGSFTSVDPIFGGNETAYSYPNDPVNRTDLTGMSQDKGGSGPTFCSCNWSNSFWKPAGPAFTYTSGWASLPAAVKTVLDLKGYAEMIYDAAMGFARFIVKHAVSIDKFTMQYRKMSRVMKKCQYQYSGAYAGRSIMIYKTQVVRMEVRAHIEFKFLGFIKGPSRTSWWMPIMINPFYG